MKLNVTRIASLPPMAWALKWSGGRVDAVCGSKTLVADNGAFEGGWSGGDCWQPWSDQTAYFGSGFYLSAGELVLIAASHTCEAVFTLETSEGLYASNSVAFLLTYSKSDLAISDFSRRLWSLTKGVSEYGRELCSIRGQTLGRYMCGAVVVSSDLTLKEIASQVKAPAATFDEYKKFLLRVVSDVRATSGSSRLVSYLSKGYDSVACAALMRELGGGTALSITTSRYGVDDSGAEIANALGVDAVLIERPTRETYPGGVAGRNVFERLTEEDISNRYEFFVGLNMADECLNIDGRHLQDTVVLTGFHGDKIWDINQPGNRVLERGDSTGSSLYEFRLRTGFVHVPVPMIGAWSHPELLELGQSCEMASWRLGNKYDRPIARRLGEEAGVPRDFFGQKKQAAATMTELTSDNRIEMFNLLKSRYKTALNSSRVWLQ